MFAESDAEVLSDDGTVHKAKVAKGNYAYFAASTIIYDVLAANYCDITRLPDQQLTSAFGFYLQKGSPYTGVISDE